MSVTRVGNQPQVLENTFTLSRDALSELQKHLTATSDLYRKKVEELKALALEVQLSVSPKHLEQMKKNKESIGQMIVDAFKSLGEFIYNLHKLLEPAASNFKHIMDDTHKHLYCLKQKFENDCEKLSNTSSPDEQKLIKLDILRVGVGILEVLIKMEVNVSAMLKECVRLQKAEQKYVNLGANLLVAILIASLGNVGNLQLIKLNWEDFYRNYLFNAVDGGKSITLTEMNFELLLARGIELVKKQVAEQKPNPHRYFTPDQNVRAAADKEPGLQHSYSSPALG